MGRRAERAAVTTGRSGPRVLVVTNDFPPRRGGIEAFVRSLCDGLDPDALVVLTASMPGSERADAALAYPVVRVPTSVLLPTPSTARQAEALLHRHGCDAVVFGAAAPLAVLASRLRAAGAGRVVALTHGHEVWWAKVPGARTVLRRIAADVDVLTYVSEFCRAELAAALGPAQGVHWAPLSPGVDVTRFGTEPARAEGRLWRRRWLIPSDVPVVLAAARLVRRKGQDVLIDAWRQVSIAHPEARLVILGDGPDRTRLVRLVTRHALHGTVRVVPGVSWEEMPAVYAAANVFALPCRTRLGGLEPEAFGIVFVEAAAAGLPVVAGRSGGTPETLIDGETGHLVEPTDAVRLADVLCRLLDDPEAAGRLGRAGRSYAARAHSLDRSRAAFRQVIGAGG